MKKRFVPGQNCIQGKMFHAKLKRKTLVRKCMGALFCLIAGLLLFPAQNVSAGEKIYYFNDFEKDIPGTSSDCNWGEYYDDRAATPEDRVMVSNLKAYRGKQSILIENGPKGMHTGIGKSIQGIAKETTGYSLMEMYAFFDGKSKDVSFLIRYFPYDAKGKLGTPVAFSALHGVCAAHYDPVTKIQIGYVPTGRWCRFSMKIPLNAPEDGGKTLAHLRMDVLEKNTWKQGKDITIEVKTSNRAYGLFQILLMPYARNMKMYVDDVKLSHVE